MTSHKVANLAAWDAAVLDAHRLVTRAQHCRAYQFADGFDNYSTLSSLWDTVSGSPSIGTSYRRFAPPSGMPGQGVYFPAGAYAQKNLQSSQSLFIPKVAFYQVASVTGPSQIFGLYDSNTSQLAICVTASGAIAIYTGWQHVGGNTLLATTPSSLIAPSHWYSIEAQISINTTGGSVTVWVNGIEAISVTGVNTAFSGNNFAQQFRISDSGSNGTYFDDVRVWDNTGSTQNTALGITSQDSRLITKLPSAAGALTQFTPNGASANWQCVDDNPPDDDTTYVSGSTAGLTDAYAAPAAGFTAAPVMVVARARARKDDSNTRELAVGVDSSGHTAVGPTFTLGSSYSWVDGCIADDPNTSATWAAVGADAAQILVEEIA